ncbi:ABC transporter permease [Ulvibacter antarcticus]|uniref:Lipopolysaccharide transport system permease protein n=1 Tax=Ulvibacter antarcticus TaxID=442714 RepID=A0A3L9YB81_9FLAO|nr:ABC transporter permease [Ulvibacter antarcticus]RMA57961.1 lipopolysaccharide transport system permease protein [Ulvibacter antarcticus]
MLETRVYQKENTTRFGKLLGDSIRDILSSRFLAKQLAIRDIKSQYRQSYFGLLWIFVAPLGTALVWIFLNNSGTVNVTDTGMPYPVYVFSGTLLWSIITESINSPMSSTNGARSIISKINFPKEALIISGIYKLMFNSSVKVILLIVLLFSFGIGFNWSFLLFPLALLGAVLFGTTVGLFLTPIGMLYSDIGRFISLGLQFLMYATPVVYAIPKEGVVKTLMEYNPISPLILTARDLAIGAIPDHLSYYFLVIGLCIPLSLIGLVFYRISIPIIVERLSA